MSIFTDHRVIFIAHNGAGPWSCHFCDELVVWSDQRRGMRLAVHHCDENQANNGPENLKAAHNRCHSRHHNLGRVVSQETRAKISAANLGKRLSPETREKIGVASRLRGQDEDFIVKCSEAGKRGAAKRWG